MRFVARWFSFALSGFAVCQLWVFSQCLFLAHGVYGDVAGLVGAHGPAEFPHFRLYLRRGGDEFFSFSGFPLASWCFVFAAFWIWCGSVVVSCPSLAGLPLRIGLPSSQGAVFFLPGVSIVSPCSFGAVFRLFSLPVACSGLSAPSRPFLPRLLAAPCLLLCSFPFPPPCLVPPGLLVLSSSVTGLVDFQLLPPLAHDLAGALVVFSCVFGVPRL